MQNYISKLISVLLLASCACLYGQQDIIITKSDTIYGKITGKDTKKLYVDIKKGNKTVSSHLKVSRLVDYRFSIIEELKDMVDSSSTYTIVTLDKSEYIGKIGSIWHDSIEFTSKYLGTINIRAEHIKKISGENYIVSRKGDTWFPNPNETRYYFGPSAYNLKKGEGYYQNIYALVSMVNVGLTDNISVGAGLEFVSTFTGNPTLFLTPKVGFPIGKKFGLSVGILGGVIGGETSAGILYSVGTYGSEEHNLTFGMGYGFIDNELSNSPILTFSGMTRVGRKVSLITENWFIPIGNEYFGLITYGIRLFGPKMSFDFALINNSDIAEAIPVGIPYIDFVIKF